MNAFHALIKRTGDNPVLRRTYISPDVLITNDNRLDP